MSVMDAVAALDAPLPEETGEQGEVEAQTEEADEVEAVESEEEGNEPESDDGSDDEGDEPEQVAEPEAITIEVDGETVTVNRDELKASYMRQKDYTRKTQELAEQRKAFEAEAQQIASERQQYAQLLGALEQQLQQTAGAEPDWDTLRATDPIEYSLQWTEWQRGQQKRQLIAAEQQRMQQLAQVEQQKAMAQTLERERQALLAVVPEWKDSERAKTEKQMVIEQGKKLGFSDDELAQAFDHRAIVALRKAALYDQLMSKKQSVEQSKPAPQKVVKPGTKGTVDNSAKRRAEQRFNSTGSIRDAAALLSFLKS
jgi:hypothetical protein